MNDAEDQADDFTEDELADARRGMMALLRACHDGDHQGTDALLRRTSRELRALVETFQVALYGALVQRAYAYTLLPEDKRALVDNTPLQEIVTDPQAREGIGRGIESLQALAIWDD